MIERQAVQRRSLIERAAEMTAAWRRQQRLAAAFGELNAAEQEILKHDLGLTGTSLRDLVDAEAAGSGLLDGMLRRIGLNRRELRQASVLRDVERTCVSCRNKGRCRAWAEGEGEPGAVPNFCPNGPTFQAVKAARDREVA
jgi:hypothetical protein